MLDRQTRRLQRFLKRGMDVSAAAVGLTACTPLLAVTSAIVRIKMGSPILFRQKRPGLHGSPFELWKFRTMRLGGTETPDSERLTPLGRWLRSTSIDEIPTLWNVLRGDMSFVGPRPLLTEYLDRYTSEQARRHEALPGITGWAQIHGRNLLSWEEKFELDVWYVDNWSLALDLLILWRTVGSVLRREGISAAGEATMSPFQGSTEDRKMSRG